MSTAYYLKNKERLQEYARNRQALYRKSPGWKSIYNARRKEFVKNRRLVALAKLGDSCKHCGISDMRVFQIDHVNNNGAAERATLAPHQFYKKVLDCKTDEYQILCANCNWLKRDEGISEIKLKAIILYGSKCVSCNCDEKRVLHFDHINNDGNVTRTHRRMDDRYTEYINGEHSVQLLCCNCHQIKTFGD